MNAIKRDDEVIIIAGKDKGKRGRVLKVVNKAANKRVKSCCKDDLQKYYLVEGANLVKKHVRPNPDKGERGGIREQEALIHGSNIMIFNTATNKRDRVVIKMAADGTRARYFKSTNEKIDS